MNTTRREFIFGAVATTAIIPFAGIADEVFEDIRTDRYYELQGGQYGDTGGYGCPGYELGAKLIENMKYWEQCRYLEHNIESVEERGFYLTPSTYLVKPWRRYDRIKKKKKWLMEFYRRHKNEPLESWESRYKRYLDNVHTGKYNPNNSYL